MKYIQCVNNSNKNVTPLQTIDAIKNAGFDGVFLQWYNKNWTISQQEQLNYCKNLGLEIEFCHLGFENINSLWEEGNLGDELINGWLRDLDEMHENNIPMVVLHLTTKKVAPKPNEIGLKRLSKVVEYAKNKNIKVAFENTKIWGYLEYVFDNLNYDNMGICLDSGHYHCHFNDQFSWERFKNKIFAVHLHDNDKSDDQHLLIGDGTLDWTDFYNNLKQTNYHGAITLESCYRNQYIKDNINDFYKLSISKAKDVFN